MKQRERKMAMFQFERKMRLRVDCQLRNHNLARALRSAPDLFDLWIMLRWKLIRPRKKHFKGVGC